MNIEEWKQYTLGIDLPVYGKTQNMRMPISSAIADRSGINRILKPLTVVNNKIIYYD